MDHEQLDKATTLNGKTYAFAGILLFVAFLLNSFNEYSANVDLTYLAAGALARTAGAALLPAIFAFVTTFKRGAIAKANGCVVVGALTALVAVFALLQQ